MRKIVQKNAKKIMDKEKVFRVLSDIDIKNGKKKPDSLYPSR